MPTIYNEKGYNFSFFAADGKETIHVHVTKGGSNAKLWLEPEIKWAFCYGFKAQEKNTILKLAKENREVLIKKWNDYFNQYK